MGNCNSLEEQLNRILKKLDSIEFDNKDLRLKNFKQDKLILGLQQSSRVQRIRLDALFILVGRIKKELPSARIDRLEKIVDTILRVANTFRKSINDLDYFAEKQLQKNEVFTRKDIFQDRKISTIDEQLTIIKALLALISAAGGFAAFVALKLAPLIAKSNLLETLIKNLQLQLKVSLKVGRDGQKGDKGDKGDQGGKGIQGVPGDKGIQGNQGSPGGKGDKGDRGDRGIQGNPGGLGGKGDKGDLGDQGIKGVPGDKGDRGDRGDPGDRGEMGLKGLDGTGEPGKEGLQGIKGEKGDEGQVTIIEVPTLVYEKPDLTLVLAKIAELRANLIFNSQVAIATTCETSATVNTTNLPSFLNAIEDKLSAIEGLICDNQAVTEYSLGSFLDTKTLLLQPNTRFVKITVTEIPPAISARFSRVTGQPNNYQFGFVSFESALGLSPEIPWEWVNSYFYPDKENSPTKIHIHPLNPTTAFTVKAYRLTT